MLLVVEWYSNWLTSAIALMRGAVGRVRPNTLLLGITTGKYRVLSGLGALYAVVLVKMLFSKWHHHVQSVARNFKQKISPMNHAYPVCVGRKQARERGMRGVFPAGTGESLGYPPAPQIQTSTSPLNP
jgi:hypothetical protein